MRESFSQKVKNQTAAAEIRKKCCRHTCSDLAGDAVPDPERLRDIWEKCRCDGCRTVFFRELFRICGSAFVRDCLGEAGFSFGSSVRKGRSVLWLRDSGSVEDFLAYLGATSASFDVMNAKIDREFRGNVNRQVNFDTANIEKQLKAVRKYADAVESLKAAGRYDLLPEDLRLTGDLRVANEQLNLEELGKLHDPPISKSGVKHRLEKILRAAEELEEESGT